MEFSWLDILQLYIEGRITFMLHSELTSAFTLNLFINVVLLGPEVISHFLQLVITRLHAMISKIDCLS